jgi:hypothetical protein
MKQVLLRLKPYKCAGSLSLSSGAAYSKTKKSLGKQEGVVCFSAAFDRRNLKNLKLRLCLRPFEGHNIFDVVVQR